MEDVFRASLCNAGAAVRKARPLRAGPVCWNIKMLRSAPARTREGGRRRSAPGLQLGLVGSEGFATMKLFYASAACDSKLRLPQYERISAR